MKAEDLHGLCSLILESDRSITFVGISDIIIKWATRLCPVLEPNKNSTSKPTIRLWFPK
jgi:hypothetical protein